MTAPSGTTKVAGVIGHPVRHSLSPVIHNAAFRALGLDWVYVALPVEPGQAAGALAGMKALGIAGLNVTMPHKSDVAAAVDVLTPEAAALGSVNTVTLLPDGTVEGRSTDGPGLMAALDADGVELAGRRVGLVGAGGAARAVAVALAGRQVAELVVVNRSFDGATRTAALAGTVARAGVPSDLAGLDVLINAVPVGMDGSGLPVPAEVVAAGQVVVDLIYHPAVTPLLALATERGARAINGLGMLIHQAALAFERWTGEPAPIAEMRAAVTAHLAR